MTVEILAGPGPRDFFLAFEIGLFERPDQLAKSVADPIFAISQTMLSMADTISLMKVATSETSALLIGHGARGSVG
jgi:hypothetical protein